MEKLKNLSRLKKIGLGFAAFVVVAGIFGNHTPVENKSAGNKLGESGIIAPQPQAGSNQAVAADIIEVKTETKTEVIPFDSQNQNDSSLASGVSQIAVAGVNGERTLTYEVTYINGAETARKQTGDDISKPPVTQITKVGTKVATPKATHCSSGYYLNSAGNCIKSPSTSPSGATAKCRDGSYSYSQSRRGTCSSHHGVAQWL